MGNDFHSHMAIEVDPPLPLRQKHMAALLAVPLALLLRTQRRHTSMNTATVVQRTEQGLSIPKVQVRFLPVAPKTKETP